MSGAPVPDAVQRVADDPRAVRPVDPDVLQRRASNPAESVWAAASAGTGKTKVLTDRVLRLLLPRPDPAGGMRAGTLPHKILCLTFTKAGAGEMALRIGRELSAWASLPDEELRARLTRLLGRAPEAAETQAARRLFAAVVDTPGGLKIMTLHSFCQSVLGRFPLEAGLAPGFSVLEDAQAQGILLRARDRVLALAEAESHSPAGEALARLAAEQNAAQFLVLLKDLSRERAQMEFLLRPFGVDGLYARICESVGAPPGRSGPDMLAQACRSDAFDEGALRVACAALALHGSDTDGARAAAIQNWLDAEPAGRLAGWEAYQAAFLTDKGEIRSRLATKKVQEKHPGCDPALRQEAERLIAANETARAAACATLTRDLFLLGAEIQAEYRRLKDERGALDFDDLIVRTLGLLRGDTLPEACGGARPTQWILHKLDEGLDHLLIDEAQDTNPEQWEIVRLLCEEFYAGEGARDVRRTLFTVGDEKQSIFSFQRAAPEKFRDMQHFFRERFRAAGQGWADVPLNMSFRSTASVLRLVDETFADPQARAGLGEESPRHEAMRRGQAGLAELWPLCVPEDGRKEKADPWALPVEIADAPTPASRLAAMIADKVQGWIGREDLPSRGRKIRAGDILILMRTRSPLVGRIMRELKNRGIPVSGADRMVLNAQIAVQDLLALARVALLPEDDLSLACVLKSPFIGWDDGDLLRLAPERKGTLWDALRRAGPPEVVQYLRDLSGRAGTDHPYEFFSRILQQSCPAGGRSGLRALHGRLGDDASDPVEELLNAALDFEASNIPSLQQFLHWQERGDAEIKREMEEGGDCVRIMTVHGSKGLQAPVVILPDTVSSPSSRRLNRLLWPDRTGFPVPLWSPRNDTNCAAYARAMEAARGRADEEYRRLLYVALTRAEDRIYIGGHAGSAKSQGAGWYETVAAAFGRCPDGEQAGEQAGEQDGDALRLTNPQTAPPDRPEGENAADFAAPEIPRWIAAPAPAEPSPPRPLQPSRPAGPEPVARSPLSDGGPAAGGGILRGVLTHKLLQVLPDLPEDRRRDAAERFIEKAGAALPVDMRGGIVDETLAILRDARFAALFGPSSLAETPVAGLDGEGRPVAGQIDRLLVTDSEILIVDYKTNRPPPRDPRDIPPAYRAQLASYAGVVSGIWPGRRVRTFLLWTDGPAIMEIPVGGDAGDP